MNSSSAAVFLDRDGVLIEDRDTVLSRAEIRLLPGVPEALRKLKQAGFRLIVVTNQAIVARGLLTEPELQALHVEMERMLTEAGAPPLDAIAYCPHHPEATLPAYRVACECRKPLPGMILRSAHQYNITPASSFLVGDRMTDIMAGARAGCRSVLVKSGRHADPLIISSAVHDASIQPDRVCADLAEAAAWILEQP
jgi:D-glycero-D-manno-heptose 1,7-bisphosphate phosphatase